MRNLMLAMTAIIMSAIFAPNAAQAYTATPKDRAVATVAQDFVQKATWYKKRHRYDRHYGYSRYDRYDRRHYRKRHLRRKLRRFLRHRFNDHDWDRRRHYRHWD